jgi:GR25 family glycosyltransferase involved in LPS biosynthesis
MLRLCCWLVATLCASSASSGVCPANIIDAVEEDASHADALLLLQANHRLKYHAADEESGERQREANSSLRSAFIVSIDEDSYKEAQERMRAQGVTTRLAPGFNAHNASELDEALQLLKRYGMTDKLHPTVNNWLACMHTSPGAAPNLRAALAELSHAALSKASPKNVEELLARDGHRCVPKVVAIAAAHVRLWEQIAAGEDRAGEQISRGFTPEPDPWYLVMEDDAELCPHWQQRLAKELPQVPADADVLKLFFFGHWRAEDRVRAPDGSDTPFLEARDPLKGKDLVTAALYEILKGGISLNLSWASVPIAGFYAGTQAYLVRRSGARKLLEAVKGSPFQDIDMTMMLSVKHYVWRRVMTSSVSGVAQSSASAGDGDGVGDGEGVSLLQTVPMCNVEPRKDWFWW